MICLYAETRLSSFAFILYTCICVPFLQIYHSALRILSFLLDPHHQPESSYSGETPDWELDLPVAVFRDLKSSNGDDMCAICLTEVGGEDLVNKLPRCGHVFHMDCLEKWLHRCQFTCPLCRSSLLRVRPSPCRTTTSPFSLNLR